MVDLMMWLVIAALMLAAAIQGIGYYQKASFVYQAKSDLNSAHSWTLNRVALQTSVPNNFDLAVAVAEHDLNLTKGGSKNNTAIITQRGSSYCLGVRAEMLEGDNLFYSSSESPSEIIQAAELPSSCGPLITAKPPTTPEGVKSAVINFAKITTDPAVYDAYSASYCKSQSSSLEAVKCGYTGTFYASLAALTNEASAKKMFETRNPDIQPSDLTPAEETWVKKLINASAPLYDVITAPENKVAAEDIAILINESTDCKIQVDPVEMNDLRKKIIDGDLRGPREIQDGYLHISRHMVSCIAYIQNIN